MSKTYSQEELEAAIAQAVGAVQAELEELKASREQAAIEERIASEKGPLEAQISELQAELDKKVLEAEEAKKDHEELVAYLEDLRVQEEQAAELAHRREERIGVVRDVASFPDEYVDANADRWASLSDEDFEALLNDFKAVSAKREESKETEQLPAATAMTASRSDDGKSVSAISEIFDLTVAGVDLKNL